MNIKVGDTVFVRANTRDDYVGKVLSIDGPFTVTLNQCSWIADSGRFGEFMKNGQAANMETEFIGDGWMVNFSAIKPWPHKLFKESISAN